MNRNKHIGQDGNGDLIPESPWRILLLGDGDGVSLVPMRIQTVGNMLKGQDGGLEGG
jgi:hypothetical protein